MAEAFPRDRPNPPDMVPFATARAAVLDMVEPLAPGPLAILDALGCVLAEDVLATDDSPPFANSAMDGFAVRAGDIAGASAERPVALRLAGEAFAGTSRPPAVTAGTAVRIMTGAVLPRGADTVVPVEQTAAAGEQVLVQAAFEPGAFVRSAGEDVRAGARVLERGRLVDPAAVGMLASAGRSSVLVHPRPRVAVVSTGDELVEPDMTLEPGQIRDSNGPLLVAQARAAGTEAFACGRLRDEPEALRRGFALAAAEGDFVVTSGGVSVGDHDFSKQVLAELGDVQPRRVAMQPGMPQAFGRAAGTPLYALPGNPVSCFVVFEVLVRPALRKLAGHGPQALDRPTVVARLRSPVRSPVGKTSFLRVRLSVSEDLLSAEVTGAQGSGILSSCVAADGLAVVPPEVGELSAGSAVQVILLREDLQWVA